MIKNIKKVLLLGSWALKIWEAWEFDYSGSQAIKALKEEWIETVLVNPNIATNQTSKEYADKVYFLPVTPFFVEKIIEKERPDSIMLAWGGQTALNCGSELYRNWVLKKHWIRVLGTPVEVIDKTEDRAIFNKNLAEIWILFPNSFACENEKEANEALEKLGFPVIIRAAFTLGGGGSWFAYNKKDFEKLTKKAFAYSPQILVEESLKGWKEIEYEVVRDVEWNVITVCNMENFDPLWIHTWESIVVAPSQTLNNQEYQKLRSIARKVISYFWIIWECNIQYALCPKSEDYRVIEVNARLSRSSALASKATWYPLAYIAAKLALGYTLPNLKNAVTEVTTADFEPALDYLAIKIPRWDLDKFRLVSQKISSEMKSVWEIMAIWRSFEEAIQKWVRMLQIWVHGLCTHPFAFENLDEELKNPTIKRIYAVAKGFDEGYSVEKVNEFTWIDKWFLYKIKNIVDTKNEIIKKGKIDKALMLKAKKYWFSDNEIWDFLSKWEMDIRNIRKKYWIIPYIKQIDTLAWEFPAQTNYLYVTYHWSENDILLQEKVKKKKVMVLWSWVYSIWSSVEFDWSSVTALKTLREKGYETIMVNYNPETVSTDFDNCDKLYFEGLSLERVLDIYDSETPYWVILSTWGQIANNIALKLKDNQMNVIWTGPENIHLAESRDKFSQLCDELWVNQPSWEAFATVQEAENFSNKVWYPVLIRPSFVLSWAAMSVAKNLEELRRYLAKASKISSDAPVVVSKFEVWAKEIEIDAVANKGELIIYAITEHIENAWVHSWDATVVIPPQKTYMETVRRSKVIAKKLCKKLNITGPFNIQFLAKNNEIKVIELNLRASRSFPFISKATWFNFIEIAVRVMLWDVPDNKERMWYKTLDLDYVCVKAPQFSYSRLSWADPVQWVEMASTWEVWCFWEDLEEAFLKSMLSIWFRLPSKRAFLSAWRTEDKADLIDVAQNFLKLWMALCGTSWTVKFLKESWIKNIEEIAKVSEDSENNILNFLKNNYIDLVINIPRNYSREERTDGYEIRRQAIDVNVPLITNVQISKLLSSAMIKYKVDDLKIEPWVKYKNSYF